MPYIKKEDREKFNIILEQIKNLNLNVPGELNYLLTKICLTYLENNFLSYTTINDIIGVLECVKQEFYRRAAAPYENEKIESNGDLDFPIFINK